MIEHRGHRVTLLCTGGTLDIFAPSTRGVKFAPMEIERWRLCWREQRLGHMTEWTEKLEAVGQLRGLGQLRRVMMLLRTDQPIAAMQEAALLPEPYTPVWALIHEEVRRRGQRH